MHVSSASWKNAMWCKANEHNFSDQPRPKNENHLYWTDHAFVSFYLISLHPHNLCGLIHWWSKSNRKGLQTNDTSIWIVIYVFMGAICFQFSPCTICVNTEISQAVMATAFNSVQCSHSSSISCTIMLDVKIVQHVLPYFIKTVAMHKKLAIMYSSI